MADFPSLAPSPDMGQLATGAGAGIAPPSGTTVIAPPPAPPAPPPVPINYGGATLPDMGDAYQQTMQQVGVEKALKAIAASEQWMAQRGYQTDLQSGMRAQDAFVKWGPLLFGGSGGMSDAMQLQQPPAQPTDLQKAQLAHTRAETTKLLAPSALTPHEKFGEENIMYQRGRQMKMDAEKAKAAASKVKLNEIDDMQAKSATTELRTVQTTLAKGGLTDTERDSLQNRAGQLSRQLLGFKQQIEGVKSGKINPAQVKTKEERDALEPGTQYIGPDGQTYTKGE